MSPPAVEEDPNAYLSDGADSPAALTKALKWTWMTGGVLTLVMIIAWPLLALPAGVFNKPYFTMWIIIALIWGITAAFFCIFTPIFESRKHIAKILAHLFTCAPTETAGEAFHDAAKDVLPPSADAAVEFDQNAKAAVPMAK